MRKEWTDQEDQQLIALYKEKSVSELALILKRTKSSIEGRIFRLNLHKGYKKYSHNENYFEIPNLENSYWAGIIAADGWIREVHNTHYLCFALKKDDGYHVKNLATTINYTGLVKERIYKNYVSNIIEICSCKRLVDNLIKNFNITPNKSLTLKPPNLIDNFLKLAYIKGYLDGDGSLRLEKNRVEMSFTGTFEVLSWIQQTFDNLIPPQKNMYAKARQIKNRKISTYKVTGIRALMIAKEILKLDLPKLKRKWDKLNNYELKSNRTSSQSWYNRFN